MRFVPPIATLTATADEPVTFDGDPRAGNGRWPR
jgi:hypothetical protein